MTEHKATRAKIKLTANLIVDGWMYQNIYMMSGTDATRVIKKHRKSIGEFLNSRASKTLSDKDKHMWDVDNPDGKGGQVTLYTTETVKKYWLHWAFKGNQYAGIIVEALMSTDLDRLFDVAFLGSQQDENVYENTRTLIEQLELARDFCKSRHPGFQLKCVTQKFAAYAVHNRMTLKISGMDAKLARELKMILEGDENIGLDHYNLEHELALRQLAIAKRIFTGMRTPSLTWQEQVDRAVKRARREVRV